MAMKSPREPAFARSPRALSLLHAAPPAGQPAKPAARASEQPSTAPEPHDQITASPAARSAPAVSFRRAPHEAKAIEHRGWADARAEILSTLAAGPGLVSLLAPSGSGKSLLLAEIADRLTEAGGAVVTCRAGEPVPPRQPGTVLILDDAGAMAPESLAALLEEGELSCVLAGPPELAERLRELPATSVIVPLPPLADAEVGPFLRALIARARLPRATVTDAALTALVARSGGVPRALQELASTAFWHAARDGAAQVTERDVEAASSIRYGTQPAPSVAAPAPSPSDALADPMSAIEPIAAPPPSAAVTGPLPRPPAPSAGLQMQPTPMKLQRVGAARPWLTVAAGALGLAAAAALAFVVLPPLEHVGLPGGSERPRIAAPLVQPPAAPGHPVDAPRQAISGAAAVPLQPTVLGAPSSIEQTRAAAGDAMAPPPAVPASSPAATIIVAGPGTLPLERPGEARQLPAVAASIELPGLEPTPVAALRPAYGQVVVAREADPEPQAPDAPAQAAEPGLWEPALTVPGIKAAAALPSIALAHVPGEEEAALAERVATGLRAAGLDVARPSVVPMAATRPVLRYVFAEDRASAQAVQELVAGLTGTRLPIEVGSTRPLPRPGMIEIVLGPPGSRTALVEAPVPPPR